MKNPQLIECVLVLVAVCFAGAHPRDYSNPNALAADAPSPGIGHRLYWPELDYYPCLYYLPPPYFYVKCAPFFLGPKMEASAVLNAFRRNENRSDIELVDFFDLDDMTDSILAEIMDIIASAASDKVITIYEMSLHEVKKVPEDLRRFNNLQYFQFVDTGVEVFPSGSLTFSSNSLVEIFLFGNPYLEVIEPGAFRGNFNGTTIHLNSNNLKEFDEAVFKPLLSSSTVTLLIDKNPFNCSSCGLAWIVRDNRQYFSQIFASCNDVHGNRIDLKDVDPITLKDC